MKNASWIVALVLGVVIGVAVTRMIGTNAPPSRRAEPAPQQRRDAPAPTRGPEDPRAVYRVPADDSPAKGPADALVTVVISSDFQCPFCKRVLPVLDQLEKSYGQKIRFVFKHSPLGFHDRAIPAAIAAEEARAQGGDAKFWAMHDALFESAPALDRAALEAAAQKVGLDLAAFRRALDEQRHLARVKRDQALAASLGATGTPSFFVNGRKLVGAQPYDRFQQLVDEELAKAEKLARSGVPAGEVYARTIEKGATETAYLPPGARPAGQQPPPPAPSQAAKVTLRPDDPARGPDGAKVTVVVFSDFECPFCSRVEPTLRQVEETWPGAVRVVWKHQPLPFHQNAVPAAIAAEAARAQGKFWQMHDKLFAGQRSLSTESYERWAKEIGLDLERFRRDVGRAAGRARIEEDQRVAAQVGAQGTPTLFLNCRKVVGAVPFESLRPVVDEELKKAEALAGQGTQGAALYERLCDQNVKALAAAAVR
jgi:protein-disulfide isomerase